MNGFALEITLLEDCVFPERAATEGGHRGLSYIPGGALLGAAASRLYGSLSKRDAFLLFHSGKVRFGNALPVATDGSSTFPVPFAWHHAKGETPAEDGRFVPGMLRQLYPGEKMRYDRQPQQLRHGYVSRAGHWMRPETALGMKTAINPKTGKAREAALFGYDSLSSDLQLLANIAVDDDVPVPVKTLREALTTDEYAARTVTLGRIRTRSSACGRDATYRTRCGNGRSKRDYYPLAALRSRRDG